jgi:hypothetical protein
MYAVEALPSSASPHPLGPALPDDALDAVRVPSVQPHAVTVHCFRLAPTPLQPRQVRQGRTQLVRVE